MRIVSSIPVIFIKIFWPERMCVLCDYVLITCVCVFMQCKYLYDVSTFYLCCTEKKCACIMLQQIHRHMQVPMVLCVRTLVWDTGTTEPLFSLISYICFSYSGICFTDTWKRVCSPTAYGLHERQSNGWETIHHTHQPTKRSFIECVAESHPSNKGTNIVLRLLLTLTAEHW